MDVVEGRNLVPSDTNGTDLPFHQSEACGSPVVNRNNRPQRPVRYHRAGGCQRQAYWKAYQNQHHL